MSHEHKNLSLFSLAFIEFFFFLLEQINQSSTDTWYLLYGELCLGMALFLLLRVQSIQGPGARDPLVFSCALSSTRFITDSWGKGCNTHAKKTTAGSHTEVYYSQLQPELCQTEKTCTEESIVEKQTVKQL